jgi:hypothetical protein
VVYPPTETPAAKRLRPLAHSRRSSVVSRVPWQFDGLAYSWRFSKLSWRAPPLHLALLSLSDLTHTRPVFNDQEDKDDEDAEFPDGDRRRPRSTGQLVVKKSRTKDDDEND